MLYDLAKFMVIYFIVFLIFAAAGTLLLSQMDDFSSFMKALETLFLYTSGDIKLTEEKKN